MDFFKKAFRLAAMVVLFLLALVLVPLFCAARWFVWSLLVLAGRQKAGPAQSWIDGGARREFKARRTEVRVATLILIVHGGFAAILLGIFMAGMKTPTGVIWVCITFPMILVVGVAMHLLFSSFDEWRKLDSKLTRRYGEPVLF